MALKQREEIAGGVTMPIGSALIAANSVCKIASSVLVVATASSEASAIFVLTGPADAAANGTAAIARPGDVVLVNAHDGNLAEGEWWVPAGAGRVDSAASLTGGTQYVLGLGLQDSSAQDQKVAMLYMPHIATDAAS